jgi:hypothetical protein
MMNDTPMQLYQYARPNIENPNSNNPSDANSNENTNHDTSIQLYQNVQTRDITQTRDMNLTECPICLQITSNQDGTRQTECGHLFHKECIQTWLLYNSTCPVCRCVLMSNPSPIFIAEDMPEYPHLNNENDYLPYRCICGRFRCCMYQIPQPVFLGFQLLILFFLALFLVNTAFSWQGTTTNYVSVIISSIMFLLVFVIHIFLRNDWRLENCRIVSLHNVVS